MATVSIPMASSTPSTKAASEEYVSLTHVEHVELRPDNYIGRVQPETRTEYVVKDGSMVLEEVTFSPGLLKTIVEILTNAADNRFRGTTRVDVWLEMMALWWLKTMAQPSQSSSILKTEVIFLLRYLGSF